MEEQYLPTWKEDFRLCANVRDAEELELEGTGPDAYRAVPHSDKNGNFLSSVFLRLVPTEYPWLLLHPLSADPNEGDPLKRWQPESAVVRHWGDRRTGHFVCERECEPGRFELADSNSGTPSRPIECWEDALRKNPGRKWALWRLTPGIVERLAENELMDLAEKMRDAHGMLDNWGRSWAVTPELRASKWEPGK
eukprot:gene7512-1428_t